MNNKYVIILGGEVFENIAMWKLLFTR